VLPALEAIRESPGERIELVSGTIVEEVLQDIGVLDFGKGMTAVANVALWRNRGDHAPLIGEFAFQLRFDGPQGIGNKALHVCERFFIELQQAGRDWLALGTTKTGLVYRLKGNPPQSHE